MVSDSDTINRPDNIEEEHLEFLDELRESGKTNMLGAGTYLQDVYCMTRNESYAVLNYWIKTFGDEHR